MDNSQVSARVLLEYGYELLTRLGEGSQGAVYKARYIGSVCRGDLEPNAPVAIKFIHSSALNPKEVLLHARLRHMNIIRIYDVFARQNAKKEWVVCLVLELAECPDLDGPSLWANIKATVTTNMNDFVYSPLEAATLQTPLIGGEPLVRYVFMQVACALEYLHRHPLYLSNRDVKGDNVLITTFEKHADDVFRPQVKVADFGFVGVRNRTSRLGTPDYVAPEIYQLKSGESYEGSRVDVWSAGVLLYVLAVGILPFRDHPNDKTTHVMSRGSDSTYLRHHVLSDRRLQGLTQELRDLLAGMLCVDPKERWNMTEVIHSDWCKRLDSDILVCRDDTYWTIPYWHYWVTNNEALVDLTCRAYNDAERRQLDAEAFMPFCWCLKHLRWQEVQKMLTAVKEGRDPPPLTFVSDEEWGELVTQYGGPWTYTK